MRWSNKRDRLIISWSLVSLVVSAGVVAWAMITRNRGEVAVLPGERVEGLTAILEQAPSESRCPIRFEDVTAESGIRFRHFPDVRASLLPEDMGSGIAAGDFDDDGRIDLFFVNFAGSILKTPPTQRDDSGCRLFRNRGGMRFEDVTGPSGLGLILFGMGAAWGDYDNDGDLDLYITAYGNNVLYENAGDGTFNDVTDRAGVGDSRFGAGCSWGDYDGDGNLDLYVCNYVDFVFRERDRGAIQRQYDTELPFTLNPSAYPPQPNALFRNNGDGTFEEVAAPVGVADPEGRSLSASWMDFDQNGRPDLYVANDVSNNGVFHNRGDGTFEDVGASSLAADYRGAMGIAVADFDDDLDPDLVITHWIAQENALFRNMQFDRQLGPSQQPGPWFMDAADECGLGQISLDMVGWATAFADLDNDGRRDLWLVNGSTFEQPANHRLLKPQPALLFWSRGTEDYIDVAGDACPRLAEPFVGRGGVQADLDGDGLLDLVLGVHGGEPMVLKNVSDPSGHWLRLRLRQANGNRFAIGARAYVTAAGVTRMAAVGASSSYLSQDETTLHFGLGDATRVTSLRIVWPDGTEETHADLAADRTYDYAHEARYHERG